MAEIPGSGPEREPRDPRLDVFAPRNEDGQRRTIAGMNLQSGRLADSGRLWIGLLFLVLGVAWTLDNLGFADARLFLDWWPALLVVFGLTRLFGLGCCRNLTTGTVATLIGVWLLGNHLDLWHLNLFELWPVVLILIGASIVYRALRGPSALAGADASEVVNAFAFWSGIVRKPTSQSLRAGEVTAFMGGAEIDLRQAKPVEGGAVLDLTAVMGGIDVFVPADWEVRNEVTAIMGGGEDNRSAPSTQSANRVVLRGVAIMGGIEIKS